MFEKETNGLTLEKDMCVSFKHEEGAKGPLAKDIRQEDPARVARVTAKVHYGKVEVRASLPFLAYQSTNITRSPISILLKRDLRMVMDSSLPSTHQATGPQRSELILVSLGRQLC